MKTFRFVLPALTVLCCTTSAQTQIIPPQSIEDTVLGWMTVYNFKSVRPALRVDDKLYSSAQLSIADSFANWIQASYVPKGGLGDVIRAVSPKLGLYNQNDAALPQTYGAYAKTYTDLKYDANRKMVPATNSHLLWSVMANQMYGTPLDVLRTPTQYYFTLPSFEEQGYSYTGVRQRQSYDLSDQPRLQKYTIYVQRNSVIGNGRSVLLAKDNKSPFVRVTKGEYLQATEAAVTRAYEAEKKKIYEKEQGNQRSIDYFMKYLNEKNDKRLTVLKDNKDRYKSRLNEIAEIFTTEPDVLLENYPDVFEGTGASRIRLPVYKIDPAIVELCKTDKPQWILISWYGDAAEPVGRQQHDAVLNNFDFDYVYNYFFDPEKVSGQSYKPLRSPNAKETVTATEASAAARGSAADRNIHFFDDFSTTGVGQKPAGWSAGVAAVVTKRDGLPENWTVMEGDSGVLIPRQLKTPLPQDFTVSYDLVADQHFTWGAKGLTFELAHATSAGNADSYVRLKLRPGYDGKDGEATVETKFPSGYSSDTKWFVATGFSNDKKNNRITVSIRKTGETMQVFIDKNKIAEYEKAMPSGLSFNAMSFTILGSSHGENDKFYLSNIKISKE